MNKYEQIAFKIFASGIVAGKKYVIREDGRIQALKSFGKVKKNDVGGFIKSEKNLSHNGNCWVFDSAKVEGNARVYGNARIYGDWALITKNAQVFENAVVTNGIVSDNAKVFGKAVVYEMAHVLGNSEISGDVFLVNEKIRDTKLDSNQR